MIHALELKKESGDHCNLDSHPDSGCSGANCMWLDEYDAVEILMVLMYTEAVKPMGNVPIGTVATLRVNHESGKQFC